MVPRGPERLSLRCCLANTRGRMSSGSTFLGVVSNVHRRNREKPLENNLIRQSIRTGSCSLTKRCALRQANRRSRFSRPVRQTRRSPISCNEWSLQRSGHTGFQSTEQHDEAFVRRFQSIVHFPMPRPEERYEIWQKTLPAQFEVARMSTCGQVAARYELSGAGILNVTHYCAIEALADQSRRLDSRRLEAAIMREFVKEGKVV